MGWSANAEAERESRLPLEICLSSVQQDTKHDRDKNITCGYGGVNRRCGIDPPEMAVPVNTFTVIESAWSEAPKLKRSSGRMEGVPLVW